MIGMMTEDAAIGLCGSAQARDPADRTRRPAALMSESSCGAAGCRNATGLFLRVLREILWIAGDQRRYPALAGPRQSVRQAVVALRH